MNFRIRFITAALLLFFANGADAAHCTVATTPVNFGFYDLFSIAALDSTGSITVSCNNPVRAPLPVTVNLSAGSSGSFAQRKMSSPAGGSLLYNLYSDASKSIILGDGSGGTVNLFYDMSKIVPWNIIVYGRIPAQQNVIPGVYSDSITVTIIW